MNKAIAFLLLLLALGLIVLIDNGFAKGALSMALGALALAVAEEFVKIWTKP